MIPESSENDVVTVVQGKDCKILTFFCPDCKQRFSIAVRLEGETLPTSFKGNYWIWNGSLISPTLGPSWQCVRHQSPKKVLECHIYITNGYCVGRGNLQKVKKWPRLISPPPEKE